MTSEEENTFRVLRDEDPIVTSFWCKFGLHKWTKWDNSKQHSNYNNDKWVIQRKTCVHCNDFTERKKYLKK